MKRKMYRIELKSMNDIAKEAAVLAALSNGNKHIDLKSIAAGAELECLKYPTSNTNISVNLIGDNSLTIDFGTDNLLALTEIEVLELVDEECVTLNRHGINNPDFDEALN